jgi:hypothetical protein
LNIENLKSLFHVFLALSKVLTSHAEFSNFLLSLSGLFKISSGLRLNSTRAFFGESLKVLSYVSLEVSNLRLHLLLLLLEVSSDDSISLLHTNEEVSPGFIEGVDLLDVIFGKAFNFTRFAISFPALDVLELFLNRHKTSLPLFLLGSNLSMTGPVRLKHIEGSAVFLQLLNGIVK